MPDISTRNRASPVSDTLHPRPNVRVTSQHGLPQNRRLGIKKQVEGRRRMRFPTVNLRTMTGKSREVANMLKRRRVSLACVQETKWKGAKAKEIGDVLLWYKQQQKWRSVIRAYWKESGMIRS